MAAGVMLLSTRDGESGDNPYRTGRMAVVKDDAIRRMIGNAELLEQILKCRFAFVEDSVWHAAGLPMTDVDNREQKAAQ